MSSRMSALGWNVAVFTGPPEGDNASFGRAKMLNVYGPGARVMLPGTEQSKVGEPSKCPMAVGLAFGVPDPVHTAGTVLISAPARSTRHSAASIAGLPGPESRARTRVSLPATRS